MTGKTIPPLDLMFFLTESTEKPMHVGAVQIFQLPDDAPADYMRDLVAQFKAAKVQPPFNCIPHFPRIGLPTWQVDEKLDIDYHVRHSALPAPGTEEQLMDVLSRLHSGVLNRDRPCWNCQIIEGLEGNRFAIYSKIHHAYIDGMSGVKRMYGTLSTSPTDTKVVPSWSYVGPGKPASRKKKSSPVQKVKNLGEAALGQAKAATELTGAFAKTGLKFLNLHESKAQSVFQAPQTRMNNRVEYDSRAIATLSLPIDQILQVAKAANGKVNDVVLTIIDAALQDYLNEHEESIGQPLVALCPMSLREAGDNTAATKATVLHIGLGAPGANLHQRLQQVIESSSATKEQAKSLSKEALMDVTLIMFSAFELLERSGLNRFLSPSFNILVSNVPGPKKGPMYLHGSKQLASYPISTFLPGSNLNVTVLSHGNQLDFGLVADKRALPDVHFVAHQMEQRFAELAKATPPAKKAAASKPKARRAPSKKKTAAS